MGIMSVEQGKATGTHALCPRGISGAAGVRTHTLIAACPACPTGPDYTERVGGEVFVTVARISVGKERGLLTPFHFHQLGVSPLLSRAACQIKSKSSLFI